MIFSPASIFNIVWLILISFYLIFDDGKYSYAGIWWLLIGILFVNIGQYATTVGFTNKKTTHAKRIPYAHESNLKCLVLYISLFLIFLTGVGYVRSGGIKNVADVAYDYYTNGNMKSSFFQSLVTQFQTFLLYINGFVGGRLFKFTKKAHYKLISFMVFIPPIIMMLTNSGKLGTIVVFITFLIGYLIESLDLSQDFSFRRFARVLKRYWFLLLSVFVLFVFSLTLRMGGPSIQNFSIAFNKMKSYAFGSPAAFNYWFLNRDPLERGYGVNTFMSIFNTIGLVERKQGVYQEMIPSEVWNTNVYTAFRGVIQDFGPFFGLIFLFAFGLFFGWGYKNYCNNRNKLSFWVLSNSYLFIVYSVIISPFIYLNLSMLFLLYLFFEFILSDYRLYKERKETNNYERHYFSGGQRNPSLSINNSNK